MKEKNSHNNEIKLWSPQRANTAAFLFTPIFGSWIHAKNWKELGQEGQEKKSLVVGIF